MPIPTQNGIKASRIYSDLFRYCFDDLIVPPPPTYPIHFMAVRLQDIFVVYKHGVYDSYSDE